MTGSDAVGPLLVVADLRIEVGGAEVAIGGDGDVVDVEVGDGFRTVVSALAAVPGTRRGLRRRTAAVADRLTEVGLTVVVRSSAGQLVRIGARATPGRVGQLLTGSERVELGLIPCWSAAWRGPVRRRGVRARGRDGWRRVLQRARSRR